MIFSVSGMIGIWTLKHIGALPEFVPLDVFDVIFGFQFGEADFIPVDGGHLEGMGVTRHRAGDFAETEQAERVILDDADVGDGRAPAALDIEALFDLDALRLHLLVVIEQQRPGVFGDGDVVDQRGRADRDAHRLRHFHAARRDNPRRDAEAGGFSGLSPALRA